ncbi:MAG TPA: glycosyltransferase, partial [Chthoniobacteraceae bacterium]|nr:glycosyltransferase [Chthoniobacteraceae bacterium]
DKPTDGLAGAVLAGARAATAGVVLVIDADGSHPPDKIPDVALPVIRGDKDMMIGSRYAPGGSTPGWSRKRRMMSRAASACAWPMTDVHDALSGYFAVRRDLMASIPPDAAGFKIALEILVRGGDSLRVGEAPIVFVDRELGQSKMGSKVIFTYFRRLLALSGWRESQDTVRQAMLKTGLVWLVDFALFAVAWWLHASLNAANLLGFAAGALLNAWLKLEQAPEEKRRSAPFIARLIFVSLLALFLRGGVLATCVHAFGWPWFIAVLPAIVTCWVVFFLGYALFIWPVREQYGSGVRWRVAAMGATAYLLALRVVYLYTLPLSARLAAARPSAGNWLPLWLRGIGAGLLGSTGAGINLPAIPCWLIAAWAVFQTSRRLFDKTTAFRALLLFSVLPAFFWAASVFSLETVLTTEWALAVWIISFPILWPGKFGLILTGIISVLFWRSAQVGFLPGLPSGGFHAGGALFFLAAQIVLVTPVAIVGLVRLLSRLETDPRRMVAGASAITMLVAAIASSVGYAAGLWSLAVSAALWLPLLPFIAAEMQRSAGAASSRWWLPIIFGCVLGYGAYFYVLAMGS